MPGEFGKDARTLTAKIEEQAGDLNPQLLSTIAALKESLHRDEVRFDETHKALAEYEDAYEKLTSPANRVGVFLKWVHLPIPSEGAPEPGDEKNSTLASVALGDSEYIAKVDPRLDPALLKPGVTVCLNEAYAVVNVLPVPASGRIEKVSGVNKDGRLRLGNGPGGTGGGRVIERAEAIESASVAPGDEVRLDPTGRLALEVYPSEGVKEYFLEQVPELPWDKVGGQDDAIRLIRETIEQPLLYPELFAKYDKKPIKGVLLYGPPGCGKTLIGKATAYNLAKEYSARLGHPVKEYFMAISGPKILNMWLGETERIVREVFRTAREKAKEGYLVFIFMDEAESVLRTRSSGRWLNISNTVVPQFCAELDGLQSLENVVLILTSNRPDYIDPAILRPERIDRKVKVSRPDRQATGQILDIYLHPHLPLDPAERTAHPGDPHDPRRALVNGLVEELWAKSPPNEFMKVNLKSGRSETLYRKDLVSGALLKSIVDRAKDLAIQRHILHPNQETGISAADLTQAMQNEFKENEIFPKSDLTEDWLELLDYPAENVASIKPVGPSRGEMVGRKAII